MIIYCSLLIKTLLITIKDNLSKTPPVFQNFVQICWHFLLSSRTVMKQNFPYSIYPAQLAFSASYATSSRKFCKDWSVKGRSTNFHPYLFKKCLKKYIHFVFKKYFILNKFVFEWFLVFLSNLRHYSKIWSEKTPSNILW